MDLQELPLKEEDVLFRTWLYRSEGKWGGVIDIMRSVRGLYLDANEAILEEDDHGVIRLRQRHRGKDIPPQWYPLIETRLLAPIATKSIRPYLGHVFGVGKLCEFADIKFKFKELKIKDLEIISPAEYAKRSRMLVPREEEFPDNYDAKAKIFLCHSSKDKLFVKRLAEGLTANGIDVWVDYRDILPGQEFLKRIEEGIAGCDFILVILTPNFILGPWANRELQMAIEREVHDGRVTVIPLLKKECDIPKILRIKSYADFRKVRFDKGLISLLLSISRLPLRGE